MQIDLKPHSGVRETKRRETHRRVTETALKLFAESGYETTTIDQIAEASGIARRTFFHYFESKEEIILGWQSALPDQLRAEMLKQGSGPSPLATTQEALTAMAGNMHPDAAMMIGRIMQSTAQLRAGNHAKFLQMEQAAYGALCELCPEVEERGRLRVIAMVSVGLMRLSIEAWIAEEGQKPLSEHLRANFAALGSSLLLQNLVGTPRSPGPDE